MADPSVMQIAPANDPPDRGSKSFQAVSLLCGVLWTAAVFSTAPLMLVGRTAVIHPATGARIFSPPHDPLVGPHEIWLLVRFAEDAAWVFWPLLFVAAFAGYVLRPQRKREPEFSQMSPCERIGKLVALFGVVVFLCCWVAGALMQPIVHSWLGISPMPP